jgi:hypothetical protein
MLPKIDVPIYEAKLTSTNQVVKFRPFLVKEQKLFLMASQSDEVVDVVDSIKQILNNCILTEGFDINSLPIFELEYLFLQLRARSVGELVNLKYSCNNQVKDAEGNEKTCNGVVKFDVNVLEISPSYPEGHDKKIEITENIGIVMKYPSFGMLDKLKSKTESENVDLIVECVDYIYDKEQVYYAKDTPKEELVEFIESMRAADFDKIQKFFETLPKNTKVFDFKCPKCGYKEDIEIEGIQNFFA